MKNYDITVLREVLIDFTPNGISECNKAWY